MSEAVLQTIHGGHSWLILAHRLDPQTLQVVVTSRTGEEVIFPLSRDTFTTLRLILDDAVVGECRKHQLIYRASQAGRLDIEGTYQWVCPHCRLPLQPLDDFPF